MTQNHRATTLRVTFTGLGSARFSARQSHIENRFVSRSNIEPDEFRRIAREQLAPYKNVIIRSAKVQSITGDKTPFTVALEHGGSVLARRVLLCTGMVDEVASDDDVRGLRQLWGRELFACPYCHGEEYSHKSWGIFRLAGPVPIVMFSCIVKGWTDDVVVFTEGKRQVTEEERARLTEVGIKLEERRVLSMTRHGDEVHVELEGGAIIKRHAVVYHPPQRQTLVVAAMGLELDALGFVKVNGQRETSRAGIFAAGDLCTMLQKALSAASAGAEAAAFLNCGLSQELA